MEGIKKLLGAQTAGLPNWAWLLIIAGGVAAAIIVPKLHLFGGGDTSSTDTGSTDTGTPATLSPDTSGYNPFQGGYGGGGGTTDTGTTTADTSTPTPVVPPTTQPSGTTVFPPVQPSAPAPPQSATTTKDQCKERQQCIDYHVQHTCGKLTGNKRTACIEHWTAKCGNNHPCGHSLIPAVKEDTSIWPYVRQQRRKGVDLNEYQQ